MLQWEGGRTWKGGIAFARKQWQLFRKKKLLFSIRKTSLGVGSVFLEVPVFTLTVAANEVVVQDASLSEMSLVDSTGTRTARLQSKVETTSIPATTEYLADDILEYGKTEVLTPAIAGVKLRFLK